MKTPKKVLLIGLIFAIAGVLFVSSANAAWIGNCTINNVSAETTGSYAINITSGSSTFTFTIDSTADNANAMLAIVLTAASTGDAVNVKYVAGGAMERIWLVK
jgi:hypothetical protein